MSLLRFALLWIVGAGSLFAAGEKWLHARTEHFQLYSTASEKKSRALLIQLEQFRANFLAMLPPRRGHEPRATVFLFGKDRQFQPYKPLYRGKPKDVAGLFSGGPFELVMALTDDVEEPEFNDPTEIILHEYVHQLVHTRELQLPLWLNEGLAELYSTFRVNDGQAEVGHLKEIYVHVLRQSVLLPLPQLFATHLGSPDYNEETRAGIFYAQSWALAHYLVCGADRGNVQKLERYIALSQRNPGAVEGNFTEAFGMSHSQFLQQLQNYLGDGNYFVRRSPSVLRDFGATVKFTTASELDAELALLDLRWRVHRPADTAARLLQAQDAHPRSARIPELLGIVAAADRDEDQAAAHWRRAAELGSDRAYVYAHVAQHTLARYGAHFEIDFRMPEDQVAELRALLDRALELSPDYLEPLQSLAMVEAWAPTMRIPALNRVQAGVNQMKSPDLTLLALALARVRLNDRSGALNILDAIIDGSRPSAAVKEQAAQLRREVRGGKR